MFDILNDICGHLSSVSCDLCAFYIAVARKGSSPVFRIGQPEVASFRAGVYSAVYTDGRNGERGEFGVMRGSMGDSWGCLDVE